MNSSTKIISVVTIVLVAFLLIWKMNSAKSTETTESPTSSTTEVGTNQNSGTKPVGGVKNPSATLEYYNDINNGFIIYYPRELKAESFTPFHLLSSTSWRVNASGLKRGTPVIAIPVFRVDNQALTKKTYPLFYGAEVRVGISADTAQCYAKDDGYANQSSGCALSAP